jgi:hypothetical protein
LLAARARELQAQTDLNKAISQLQRATGNTLTANHVSVRTDTPLRELEQQMSGTDKTEDAAAITTEKVSSSSRDGLLKAQQ